MRNTFFVTGTDTDVGKTLVTASLLELGAQASLKTLGLKPIAAGCEEGPEGLRNDDALLLQKHSSVKLSYSQVNPVALKSAIAPHIAAMQEGRMIQLDRLEGICRGALMTPADLKLVEGAGGWRVPLNPMENYSGLAKRLQLPVILVVGMRLGCINHALLTAEAIARDGLPIAAWVANTVDPKMPVLQENIETLNALFPFPCLGHIPYLQSPSVDGAISHLSIEKLI